MPEFNVYSFLDLSGSIAHPSKGNFVFTGEGVGEVRVEMTTEHTAHDIAADGVVMVSKIPGRSGFITVECQQTSKVHQWLLEWSNFCYQAGVAEWATATMALRNTNDGSSHDAIGISPPKIPDKSYKAQGQMVNWKLPAAHITNNNG